MGFQDFKVFNLSLLAKRCWRVILSPSYVVWIPSLNEFTPSYFTSEEDRVRHLFLHYEAEAILQIPFNLSWPEDKLIQNFTMNGIYNVKSGYKIGIDFVRRSLLTQEALNRSHEISLWNSIHTLPA
ncbi:hypothetical protein M9H77_27330 [Catharanthus roseus]|uniref:Uncharacterized protein n=1 Tax=Catharanthus roseus TaxID=4058 RepID=A0ACC0ADN6_CATRO|nr:hypothetical protein M9H77_27330 [Catharanthus roseus]